MIKDVILEIVDNKPFKDPIRFWIYRMDIDDVIVKEK
jgi:hypothetical protein